MPFLNILHGKIIIPLPRHRKTCLPKSGYNTRPICYLTDFNALDEIIGDELPGVFLWVQLCSQHGDIKEFPVAGLKQPGTGRIIGPRPAFTEVEIIPQAVKQWVWLVSLWPFAPRRRDVERFAALQFHPWGKNVDMAPATLFQMQDGRPDILIRLKACPGGALKFLEYLVDLFAAGDIFRREGNHAGGVFVFKAQ